MLLFICVVFVEECYYCSNPTECAEESEQTVECLQDISVCATFTATTDFPDEGFEAGDVIRRNCFILEEEIEGCGIKDNVEVCFCQGDKCNDEDMPEKLKAEEEETENITSILEEIITTEIITVYGEYKKHLIFLSASTKPCQPIFNIIMFSWAVM